MHCVIESSSREWMESGKIPWETISVIQESHDEDNVFLFVLIFWWINNLSKIVTSGSYAPRKEIRKECCHERNRTLGGSIWLREHVAITIQLCLMLVEIDVHISSQPCKLTRYGWNSLNTCTCAFYGLFDSKSVMVFTQLGDYSKNGLEICSCYNVTFYDCLLSYPWHHHGNPRWMKISQYLISKDISWIKQDGDLSQLF